MKKVMFLAHRLDAGGAQKILSYVANICAENGNYDVTMISIVQTPVLVNINSKVKIASLEYKEGSSWKEYISVIKKLRHIVSENRIEVICAFMPFQVKTAVLACIGLKVRIIGSERDNPYRLTIKQKLVNSFFYNKCDVVVFQTELAKKCFGKSVQKKSIIIHNPFISGKKQIVPFEGNRRKRIVSVGRLGRIKGYDFLIPAFAKVHKKFPEYSLHIYGEGAERSNYNKLINELNIQGYVFLHGVVEDVFAYENDASLFVLASRSEGIPNVMLEAMAAKIPIIASDCMPGGPRMLLEDGKLGKLVEVGDIEALSNAMNDLLNAPDLAQECADKAYLSLARFDADKIGKQWLDIFEE